MDFLPSATHKTSFLLCDMEHSKSLCDKFHINDWAWSPKAGLLEQHFDPFKSEGELEIHVLSVLSEKDCADTPPDSASSSRFLKVALAQSKLDFA